MTLDIDISPLVLKNLNAPTRIVVDQGGTSSGKTFAILQTLYLMGLQEKLHISVCAVTLPHLKKGAIKDFISILNQLAIYDEAQHNLSDHKYTVRETGSVIEFFSLDNPGKARGPRRDILFINECNLIPFETFTQLNLRTGKKVFIDYNPADEFHWIYEQLLNGRDDVTFIQSTYLDNPFLADEIKREIERLRGIDENLWKIYGLGERGQLRGIIYPNWQTCDTLPEGGEVLYGLDFGYNNPTALVQVVIKDREVYVQEVVYESHLTNNDLIERLKMLVPNRSATIYADAAEPQRIQEIYRAGFNIKAADKEVKKGIDVVKTFPVFVTKNSINIQKERNSYKWKVDIQERTLDEPVKFNDHAMDAIRYAIHTHHLKPTGMYAIR